MQQSLVNGASASHLQVHSLPNQQVQPIQQPGMMQPGMMQPGMMQPGMMQMGMSCMSPWNGSPPPNEAAPTWFDMYEAHDDPGNCLYSICCPSCAAGETYEWATDEPACVGCLQFCCCCAPCVVVNTRKKIEEKIYCYHQRRGDPKAQFLQPQAAKHDQICCWMFLALFTCCAAPAICGCIIAIVNCKNYSVMSTSIEIELNQPPGTKEFESEREMENENQARVIYQPGMPIEMQRELPVPAQPAHVAIAMAMPAEQVEMIPALQQPKGRYDANTGQENPKHDPMTGVRNW